MLKYSFRAKEKQQVVGLHTNIKDPNQACELSVTVLITMLISTSLRCLSPTITSSAAYHVKEQSVLGTNAPFTNKVLEDMCVSVFWMLMERCVWYFISVHLVWVFPTLSSLTALFPDSFCLSLQLEVLHSQTLMLIRERWGDLVQEERYVPAKFLTLTVWK